MISATDLAVLKELKTLKQDFKMYLQEQTEELRNSMRTCFTSSSSSGATAATSQNDVTSKKVKVLSKKIFTVLPFASDSEIIYWLGQNPDERVLGINGDQELTRLLLRCKWLGSHLFGLHPICFLFLLFIAVVVVLAAQRDHRPARTGFFSPKEVCGLPLECPTSVHVQGQNPKRYR